ncbi:hypothetical protein [Paenibacillus vini]|uniref:Uncharacterized protein n=1 Tax=Paenibacillus vini TaxID=1476024 RepID=A0ABQ4MBD1_9BACL|nr:hypothetical protein [Paenibacillus vini]GIP53298.1 hypothetical protein J42TS3_23330 [Paenibacillus vini]
MNFITPLYNDNGSEWDPSILGTISIPLALFGVFLFCFPDLVCKFLSFNAYRTMKPNYEFEEYIEYKEPRKITLVLIKAIGLIIILFGIYLFWNAEGFYRFWFL